MTMVVNNRQTNKKTAGFAADIQAGQKVKHIFRALSSRNYRLYFSGQLVSLIGTWMQQLALSWLTYRITQSPFMLGAIAFASLGPSIFLGPFAGILPDIFNRHKLLVTTQSLLMIQSFLLAWLTLRGNVQVWELMTLGALAGVVNSVDMPTRQSFVIDMTENKDELGNVIALNSSQVNFTRLIGPALAGSVVALWGEGTCFFLNGVSFLAVIWALLAMKMPAMQTNQGRINVFEHLKDGFRYVAGSVPIKFLLSVTALTSLMSVPFMVLLPVYVKTVFHGNAQLLGYMMAASSVGALLGTLMLASRRNVLGLAKWLIGSIFALSVSLLVFSFSTNMLVSMAALTLGGFGMITQMACSNTILQVIVDDDKRGRVMSLFTMAFLGISPVGGLAAGFLADHFGCPVVVAISGLLAMFIGIYTLVFLPELRRHTRPIYIQRGIIKQGIS